MDYASAWLLRNAVNREIENNWKDLAEEIDEDNVGQNEKVIFLYSVDKTKVEEGKMRMKARLRRHGNTDKYKKMVRKDSQSAQLDTIRLLFR